MIRLERLSSVHLKKQPVWQIEWKIMTIGMKAILIAARAISTAFYLIDMIKFTVDKVAKPTGREPQRHQRRNKVSDR